MKISELIWRLARAQMNHGDKDVSFIVEGQSHILEYVSVEISPNNQANLIDIGAMRKKSSKKDKS